MNTMFVEAIKERYVAGELTEAELETHLEAALEGEPHTDDVNAELRRMAGLSAATDELGNYRIV
jgi:hypothetical protein